MLEGLERVDWARLQHAYGPATDVPGLLRALTVVDRDTREQTLHELFGNIYHQGTVYSAWAREWFEYVHAYLVGTLDIFAWRPPE
jgi:hypothetical protein